VFQAVATLYFFAAGALGFRFTLYSRLEISVEGNVISMRLFGKTRTVDLSRPYTTTCYSYYGRTSLQANDPADSVLQIRQKGSVIQLQPLSVQPPIDIGDTRWAFIREPFRNYIDLFYPKTGQDGKIRESLKDDGYIELGEPATNATSEPINTAANRVAQYMLVLERTISFAAVAQLWILQFKN
jgi:hypothetical protein